MKRLWRILKWFGLSVAAAGRRRADRHGDPQRAGQRPVESKNRGFARRRRSGVAGRSGSRADSARRERSHLFGTSAQNPTSRAINTRDLMPLEQELTPEGRKATMTTVRPEPRADRADALRFWAEYPEAFGQLEQAANCDRYDPGLNFKADTLAFSEALLTEVQNARLVQRALTLPRHAMQMADHQLDDAAHTPA